MFLLLYHPRGLERDNSLLDECKTTKLDFLEGGGEYEYWVLKGNLQMKGNGANSSQLNKKVFHCLRCLKTPHIIVRLARILSVVSSILNEVIDDIRDVY